MKSAIYFFILIFTVTFLNAQETGKTERVISNEMKKQDMSGLSFFAGGFNYFTIGAGFNWGNYSVFSGHFAAYVYGAAFEYKTAKEFHLRPYFRFYGGSAGMLLGLSVPLTTDFNGFSLGISPEIGIGFGGFNLLYRYNFYIDGTYNCHEILLVFYLFNMK